MSKYETWNIVVQAAVAIGTFLVAAVAVFSRDIQRWLFRPRISIEIGRESPFTELVETEIESTSGSKLISQEIRLKITNRGKSTAEKCRVVIREIYRDREGTSLIYLFRSFVPKELYWVSEVKSHDLTRDIPSYVCLARIAEKIAVSKETSSDSKQTAPEYSLYIIVEESGQKGRIIEIGKGRVMLPMTVCAENIASPILFYIELFWNGRHPKDIDAARFSIRKLSRSEAEKMIGGAQ